MSAFGNKLFANGWTEFGEHPQTRIASLTPILLFVAMIFIYSNHKSKSKVPLLNPKKTFEFTESKRKQEFVATGGDLVRSWFKDHPDKPVRAITDMGQITILPPKMATEIRNDKRLGFAEWTYQSFHGHLPGFEGFREALSGSNIVQDIVVRDLTKLLNKVTEPLAKETSFALSEAFTNNKDWHRVNLREVILDVIARISSRVFLGEELCRDERWLKITRDYTVTVFTAAAELREWPALTRPVVHWFLASCRQARAQVKEAREIIDPVLEKRKQQRLEAQSRGEKTKDGSDAIDWLEEVAKGRTYDAAMSQLILSFAAIHTTTDLLSQVLLDLAEHPDMIEPCRKEIVQVISTDGWKKASLHNMKLLDSVMKESQRKRPTGISSMSRLVLEDIRLSDGTFLPKNSGIAVSALQMWSPEVHEKPDVWDGYRFYKWRDDASKQSQAHLVSTSPNHLAFGHGKHACPGRFFAANELKVALSQILLKYDWKLPEGVTPKVSAYGLSLGCDPFLQIDIRRRQEEIDIEV